MNDKSLWLVEYVGAIPCPVYAGREGYTCDPWAALKFLSKADAEEWMQRPDTIPFKSPWTAIPHGFVNFD
jgi:hypothetical protein